MNQIANRIQIDQDPIRHQPRRSGIIEPSPEFGDAKFNYEVVHQIQDLEACFHLVYQAYRQAGLTAPHAHRLRLTPFHLLDTTEVFATRCGPQILSTVSLIGDGKLGLPVESMYPVEVEDFRQQGYRMAEIGCLADQRQSPRRFLTTFLEMMHLLTQVAKFRGYDTLVATCHPSHAKLYQRLLPFRQFGKLTSCSYANGNPALLLAVSFEWEYGTEFYERFFGKMRTAQELAPRPWNKQTTAFFERSLGAIQTPEPTWVAKGAAWDVLLGSNSPQTNAH
ncbi:N-acyl amino acid synthase FeeM domain-containing protein [Rubripirellula lacrimiformis]|nr:long-chain N-acyl amino acid synthase [Rubripirellula lacrimiformis]